MEGRRAAEEVVDKVDEVVAGGSSTKALDPCLETGEVGEGPAVGKVEEPPPLPSRRLKRLLTMLMRLSKKSKKPSSKY